MSLVNASKEHSSLHIVLSLELYLHLRNFVVFAAKFLAEVVVGAEVPLRNLQGMIESLLGLAEVLEDVGAIFGGVLVRVFR